MQSSDDVLLWRKKGGAPLETITRIIQPQEDGTTVRHILKAGLHFSTHAVARLTRTENGILLNGSHARTVDIVHAGDVLTVETGDHRPPKVLPTPGNWPLPVVWEDGHLLVVNKPAGMTAHASNFLPDTTVLKRCPELRPIPAQGVARRYRIPGAKGTVGLISPVSHDFCAECRRIRVTADGKLKGCLHSREEIDLRGLHGWQLQNAIRQGIAQKPQRHHLAERKSDTPRNMFEIGG